MEGVYQEQIKRVIRSFNKLPKDEYLKTITDEIIDDYYHFFVDCYHLKDWIRNDDNISKKIQKRVELHIQKSYYLKLVADIANAIKHRKLDKKKSVRLDPNIDFTVVDVYRGFKKEHSFSVKVTDSTGKQDIFEGNVLPMYAMQEWDKFLQQNGLLGIKLTADGKVIRFKNPQK